ncbi:hypothetical protein RI054_39g145750 [Pseudoscourfieldia marina]
MVLVPKSQESLWLKGLKENVRRKAFRRALEAGEDLDKSAAPISSVAMAGMVKALSRQDTALAAEKKFDLLRSWQAGGRATEVSFTTLESNKWDYDVGTVGDAWPEPKTCKTKVALYAAGRTPYTCYFICWADVLTLSTPQIASDDEPQGLTTWLQQTCRPAKKIGDVMKELRGDVESLPDMPSAGGIRTGVANFLALHVPPEFLIHTTGHDGKGFCNLFEYIDASVAMCTAGAVVLAGWPALPRGTLSKAPVPASLDHLAELGITDMENYIDKLFRFHSQSPPMLRRDGSLRIGVRAAAASQILHYNHRRRTGEARQVLVRMVDAVEKCGLCSADESADETLARWSSLLTAKFEIDNQHLLGPPTHGAADVRETLSFPSPPSGKLGVRPDRCIFDTTEPG